MWQEINNKLTREFRFKDFSEAFTFMTRVALVAERMNHHPAWYNSGNFVKIELSTHDSGGTITDRDRQFAAAIDDFLR